MKKETKVDYAIEQCRIGRELIELGKALIATNQDIRSLEIITDSIFALGMNLSTLEMTKGNYGNP